MTFENELTIIQKLAIWALPVLFAITLREIAHGYAARALGDRTGTQLGRLTPNPLAHVDLFGTVLVPGLLVTLGGFLMGWPKPIPIDYRQLKPPRRGLALLSCAGLGANLAMALVWCALLKLSLGLTDGPGVWLGLRYMAVAGVSINVALFVLNLLPLPPLDAGRILVGILPLRAAQQLARIEPYSFIILVLLMMTPVLRAVLFYPLVILQGLLFLAFDIDSSALF